MAIIILLTAAQADQVRGPSAESPTFAALAPVALTDGRSFLGVEVLADPAHIEHVALLETLPQVEFADIASLLPAPGA